MALYLEHTSQSFDSCLVTLSLLLWMDSQKCILHMDLSLSPHKSSIGATLHGVKECPIYHHHSTQHCFHPRNSHSLNSLVLLCIPSLRSSWHDKIMEWPNGALVKVPVRRQGPVKLGCSFRRCNICFELSNNFSNSQNSMFKNQQGNL